MNSINILGVNITNLTKKDINAQLQSFLQSSGHHLIVTPNPEFIVEAQNNNAFKKILNSASLAIADGIGLKYASWILGKALQERYTGLEITLQLAKICDQNKYSIYLLGGDDGIAEKIKVFLKNKYKNIRIVGAEKGISSFYAPEKYKQENIQIITNINTAKPDILFVAFGAPKQETWLSENIHRLNSVKIGVGVGGVFNYLSGKSILPPIIIRKFGFEWLWRLFFEPWRLRRIYIAVIVFPWKIIQYKFNSILRPKNENE